MDLRREISARGVPWAEADPAGTVFWTGPGASAKPAGPSGDPARAVWESLIGRLWYVNEAATLLGAAPEAVLASSEAGDLLALTLRDGKTVVWPDFQLVGEEGSRRTGLPGMRAVLEVVRGYDRVSLWGTAGWLCSREPLLEERRPADAMREEGATYEVLDSVRRWCANKSR